jgi:hypothetical protein
VKRASEIDALPWCVPLNGLTIKIKDGSRRMAAICEPVAFPLCFRVEAVDLFAGSLVPGNPDAVFKREPLAAYHARTRLGAVRFDFNAVGIGSRAGAAADALADFTYRYAEPAGLDVIHRLPGGYSLSVEPSAASGILYVAVSWKPIVWNRADHYAQWLSYPTRVGLTPHPGSRVTIEEHPGRGFVAAGVEAGSEPAMVWLTPIDTAVE